MADFVMPSLGADMESATLTTWLVKPGDSVKRGDVVASVETTKGIIDVEIFDAGVIDSLVATPGAEVPVGGLLATYKPSGAAAPSPGRRTNAGSRAAPRRVPHRSRRAASGRADGGTRGRTPARIAGRAQARRRARRRSRGAAACAPVA